MRALLPGLIDCQPHKGLGSLMQNSAEHRDLLLILDFVDEGLEKTILASMTFTRRYDLAGTT